MHKSMTGYGRHEAQNELGTQLWEIKSVNAKQLNLRWKLPPSLLAYEGEWDKEVRSIASRGRIDIFLSLELFRSEDLQLSLNQATAEAMLQEIRKLAQNKGDIFHPDYNRLLNIPSLWQDKSSAPDPQLINFLQQGLRGALQNWDESRQREGHALVRDLLSRIESLLQSLSELKEISKDVPEEKFQALQQRVQELLQKVQTETDQERMLQELAILADRLDVSEEITRLETHLDELRNQLSEQSGSGRRLDFLLQECFREINTCANKAQNSRISRITVDFKSELEKCREQVQNLE
jgi:uncharacterized protein (TIGR00255 family)